MIDTIRCKKRFIQHVEEAFDYVPNIEIFLCSLKEDEIGYKLKNIELNLLYMLQPDYGHIGRGKTKKPALEIDIVHENAQWVKKIDRWLKALKPPRVIIPLNNDSRSPTFKIISDKI